MLNALFHAHSGLRYLVLLLGALAFLWGLASAARGRGPGKAGRILGAAFVGTLDLQVLLGLGLLFVRGFYPQLFGHITAMLLAIALGHVAAIASRQHPDTPRGSLWLGLGALVTLLVVVAGIMAIGRPVL